jgi:hypothetical protein
MQLQDPYANVKPRDLDPNPRCYECKSPDPRGRAPMFHPAHRWGPCEVRMPGGNRCGCMADVQHGADHTSVLT